MNKNNEFLTAALEYLEKGFYIFPLKPKSKAPLTSNGFKGASNSPEQIRAWWAQYPDANIGVATGQISGIFVLDIDGDNFPKTLMPADVSYSVKTSKGHHVYFYVPKGVRIR